MNGDLHVWIENAITKREAAARAATERQPYDEWDAIGGDRPGDTARSCWEALGVARMRQTPAARDLAQHIALNDPASVLRRCAADRTLLADITAERHLVIDGDCWYTCAAATEERDGGEPCNDARLGEPCDCGRDERVQRRLQLIAESYGWQEEPAS